ncbi:DUF1822 family protein [Coleofasciculus sp. FACHB-64]|uniref:DUF1822 family protein n=1 Tax=Cyanophyceae TaxID=3028117 RepID=UPI00168973E0|nr:MULTISPECIES: DUF1822 family protein [unclassified Coleofasciculus]MBD1841770.1 DUF1822 family protein [Coleofasciculus sp. FACHB-501]MBD2047673.1 DUF1822 family protein [Coleofasciculus sp. FACHB-64]
MNYLTDLTDDWVEFEELAETIPLESEQLDQAVELSNQVGKEDRKWQIYLQALSLLSFEEWLRKREPEISLNREHSSVLQPQYVNAIDAVFNLRVGEFKVCLIPTITLTDKEVTIPRAVVDLPEFTAHFYVVIGIEEDLGISAIRGFLRHDQLINYQPQLQSEVDWNYQISIDFLNREPNELLLYLQCLIPSAIPLPEIPTNRQATLARMQSTLLTLLPQLRNRPLWQVLTWEQGTAVLTTPDLLNWLYQPLTENTATVTNHLSELLQILTQQAVNVRNWLRNQVDEVMQELSWEALPAPSPLRGTEPLRELPASFSIRRNEQNPSQELDEILIEISRNNQLEIPANTGRAYRDLTLGNRVRLYAVTWSFPDDDGWTLLLILKAISGNEPDDEMTLRVSDRVEVLAEDTLHLDGDEDYIFTQVAGTYQDKFLATITSETGEFQTLPPFEFIL